MVSITSRNKKMEVSDGINKNNIEINCNEKEPFSALVFKTIIDPFIGRLSLFKVTSGVVNEESSIYNSTKDKKEKVGKLYFLRGKQQIQTDRVISGDIGQLANYNIPLQEILCVI